MVSIEFVDELPPKQKIEWSVAQMSAFVGNSFRRGPMVAVYHPSWWVYLMECEWQWHLRGLPVWEGSDA